MIMCYYKAKLKSEHNMKKILQKLLVGLLLVGTLMPAFATPAYAGSDEPDITYSQNRNFLGLVPWYNGLATSEGKIVQTKANCGGVAGCIDLPAFVATIVFNVLDDLMVIASFVLVGFVIYGGYLYLLSAGNPIKAATGKKAIVSAFIGFAVTMLAEIIFTAIRVVILSNSASGGTTELGLVEVDATTVVENLIGWIIGIAGVVAAVFMVYGGFTYITANGDPQKLMTAKKAIIYAAIGLLIVGLTNMITAFVTSNIRSAKAAGTGQTLIIPKEENEKII